MINNLDALIRRETFRAINSIFESSLSQDGEDERERQKRQEDAIHTRNLKAKEDSSKKDEADDESEAEEKKDEKPREVDPGKREDRTKGKGTPDSPKLKNPDSKTLADPPVKSVIDKLNALRGGKSLSDPDVKKSFDQYYQSLSNTERQTLLLFLTGIAQVLSEVEPGDEALEPSDAGLRVKDTKDKTKIKQTDTKEKSKEGTPENPIVVGEVANKAKIKRALEEYRKYQ